jgi:Protein of unknown function (DUF1302)
MRTGFEVQRWRRGTLRLLVASAFVLAGLGLCVASSWAGDPAAQLPAGAQDGSSSASNVLAQTNTLSQPSGESLLRTLHVTGFLNQRAGMWLNPTALKQWTPSRSNLATLRTWLQTDVNWRPSTNNQFFLRTWFVYEPPYSTNSANNHVYQCFNGLMACGNTSNYQMYRLNDFYNQYTVRDAWWKLTTGPLTLYLGNQIVVWGQSLAFRVGDVINPQDTSWAFGFANLEQSRQPLWMIHPILNLPDFGPLNSNFVEGVLIPGFQPQWNSSDYPDHRIDGEMDVAGRMNTGFPSAMRGPSGRFDVPYDHRWYPGTNAVVDGWSQYGPFGPNGGGIIPGPFQKEFMWCSNLNGVLANFPGNNPIPTYLRRPCDLSATTKAGSYTNQGALLLGPWRIPPITFANMQEGLRLHTLWGDNEITALYYNTFQTYPHFQWQPFTNVWAPIFQPVQIAGVTLDRPVPVPQSLAEYLPLIMRAEMTYSNHEPYTDFDPFNVGSVHYSDTVRWMAALDMDQAYSPWLTATGNLSANLEVEDQIPLDMSKQMFLGTAGGGMSGPTSFAQKNMISILFNAASSWWWNDFAVNLTGIYVPDGNTFALFPGIQLNPPWTNKYFARIDFIDVLGSNYENGLGWFKGEGMLMLTGQYNFDLM